MKLAKEVWQTLSAINVNENTEKKGNLTYLSWAYAWATLMEHYPQSTYRFDNEHHLGNGSVMCSVTVSICDGDDIVSRTMHLPVMDNRNNAMDNPNSRQISDTRMRCLTKCLAMFGLGFYIYAGEDLPKAESDEQYQAIGDEKANEIHDLIESTGSDRAKFMAWANVDSLANMTHKQYETAKTMLEAKRLKEEDIP